MTREELVKKSFKPYMVLMYEHRVEGFVECLLVAVDFDNEIFTLRPLDSELFVDEDFTCSISNVSFKKKTKELKILK